MATQKKVQVKVIGSVKNQNNGCTVLQGMCISNGGKLYCAKINKDDSICCIVKKEKYTDKDYTVKEYNSSVLGHANDFAYYNNHIYITKLTETNKNATKNKVVKMTVDGDIVSTISLTNPNVPISAITHYKNGQFLIKTAGTSNCSSTTYSLVSVSGNTFKVLKKITIKNPLYNKGYNIRQGIHYYNGKFYNIISKKNEKTDSISDNVLLVTDLKTIADGKMYSPSQLLTISSTTEKLYEVESISNSKDGKIIVGMNISSGDKICEVLI